MTNTEQSNSIQESDTQPPSETPVSIQPEFTPEPVSEPKPSEPAPTEQPKVPVEPQPEPVITQPAPATPKSFLAKALESIQFRKKAKLEKIMKLANEKGIITNNDVEKRLRVSDATATRYLSVLVKQNRLKMSGDRRSARYEPIIGSNGGN